MSDLYVSLLVLMCIFLLVFIITVIRTRKWKQKSKGSPLGGLALPDGSIRGLLAFLVVGAFILFVFFGKEAVCIEQDDGSMDTSLYTTVLTSFGTLTGAISGFYFGSRAKEDQGPENDEDENN